MTINGGIMKIRKKFSLAILFSIGGTIMVFVGIKSPEIMAYGVLATGVLAAFGVSDVLEKKSKGD